MRIAYFDPFSGASGDMILGALVDAGLPAETLNAGLAALDLDGYELRAEPAERNGITGTHVTVAVADDQPPRDWRAIHALIDGSHLEPPVKTAALAIFGRLAEAEAKVHGTAVEDVHFHEVGGVDAIVDICGACIGLAALGIEAVFSGPPRLGQGMVRTQHGLLPVPAPATAALLADAAAPTAAPAEDMRQVEAELLTPTGAAILTTLAEFRQPGMTMARVGYGFGTKRLPWPNALRVVIAEMATEPDDIPDRDRSAGDAEILLEANIDDMNPQFFEILSERLFAAGALDVWLTPVQMKKGRPGVVVGAIAPADYRHALEAVFFADSPTLGVRATAISRTKADRRHETVTTRWGEVRVKLRGLGGRVLDAMPEYDDTAAIARKHGVPVREVWAEAHRLGESFVGRRWETFRDDGAGTRGTRAPTGG